MTTHGDPARGAARAIPADSAGGGIPTIGAPVPGMATVIGGGLITEHLPCPWPIVYGYLRVPGHHLARQAALTGALAEYCRQHELALAGVFTDHGSGPETSTASFVGLLDVLGLAEIYGVVVPSPRHLGRGRSARTRLRQIDQTGSRLLVIRATSTNATGFTAPGGAPRLREELQGCTTGRW